MIFNFGFGEFHFSFIERFHKMVAIFRKLHSIKVTAVWSGFQFSKTPTSPLEQDNKTIEIEMFYLK